MTARLTYVSSDKGRIEAAMYLAHEDWNKKRTDTSLGEVSLLTAPVIWSTSADITKAYCVYRSGLLTISYVSYDGQYTVSQ